MFVYWTKYKARSWGEISVFKPFSPMEQDMLLEAVQKGRHAHAQRAAIATGPAQEG